jgi:hypothetical protein
VFSREGLSIAKAVKAELPGWTVVYCDEALASANLEGRRTGPRVYEITLPKDSEPPI